MSRRPRARRTLRSHGANLSRLSQVSWDFGGGPMWSGDVHEVIVHGGSDTLDDVALELETPGGLGVSVPEQVRVAMVELAGDMQEGLLALAVGAGLQVRDALMAADVTALAGPRGGHDPERTAVRHGTGPGSVTLGGRRVPVQRPRRWTAPGSCRCPPTSCSARPRCSAGWRWRRCSPGCRPDVTRSGWSRSGTRSPSRPRARASRRCRAGSSRRPETALAGLLAGPFPGPRRCGRSGCGEMRSCVQRPSCTRASLRGRAPDRAFHNCTG